MTNEQLHLMATNNGNLRAAECVEHSDNYGFAQILVSGDFGQYILDAALGSKTYYKTRVRIEVQGFQGEYEKRKAFSEGYADVLKGLGVNVITDSQIDDDDGFP